MSDVHTSSLLLTLDHVVLGSEGELGDVLHAAVEVDHQAVVLPVAPGPGLALQYICRYLGVDILDNPTSGTISMGSMERIMPGASTVSTSSRSSRPGSLPRATCLCVMTTRVRHPTCRSSGR